MAATGFSVLALTPASLWAQHVAGPDSAAHAAHAVLPSPGPEPAAPTMTYGPLGVPAGREGSGTSWLPDATPMAARHRAAGPWQLMLHGDVYVQYIDQGSERGQSQFGSINWLMGMARRPLAGGELGLRAMLSLEPFTIPGCGYPVLLATGETCDGAPLHDAQHPHDLFMELAASYERRIGDRIALQLYGGPAAEPALGPVAFPHRVSALGNPLAPISHHWLDATHITYGVATAGVYGTRWKVEASLFNGREPDEERRDLDLAPLDSYAGRFWLLPTDRWALQLSAGRLNEAEPGHEPDEPRRDVARYTASATYYRPLASAGGLALTAGWGRNVEEGRGTNAMLVESSASFRTRHTVFGRAEWTEKVGHDLGLEDAGLAERIHDVRSLALGYARDLETYRGWVPSVGARASVNFLPKPLKPFYGERHPVGFTVFVNLRPDAMVHDGTMPMEGVAHEAQRPAADAAAPGHAPGATPASSPAHMRMLEEMHARMMADPVIRERVASDPVLQRLVTEMAMLRSPHGPHAGDAAEDAKLPQALDFVLLLLSAPDIQSLIRSDQRLRELWADPRLQRRLEELRRARPGGD